MTDVALSDRQIIDVLAAHGLRTHVVEFADIPRYRTPTDLLAGDEAVVIYVRTGPSFGHWTTLFRRGAELEVFDSAGAAIDQDLLFLPPAERVALHETQPFLLEMLEDPARNTEQVEVNGMRYQRLTDAVNTCGRHVIVRLLHRNLSSEQYDAFMRGAKRRGETYDQLVVRLTNPLLALRAPHFVLAA